jgi:hypothetical protein
MTDTAFMEWIGVAVQLGQAGDRAAARRRFDELWNEAGSDAFQRCVVAHYAADVQDDVRDELAWDLRALDAVDQLGDERLQRAGMAGGVRGFRPSLHLNAGDCYRRLGDLEQAREHARLGQDAVDALPDDEYGRLIRRGLTDLAVSVASG